MSQQRAYLEQIRDSGTAPNILIPAVLPADDKVRDFTRQTLKDGKGWGRAADLIERCAIAELPPSISAFLERIYALFPRPETPDLSAPSRDVMEEPADGADPADVAEAQSAEGA